MCEICREIFNFTLIDKNSKPQYDNIMTGDSMQIKDEYWRPDDIYPYILEFLKKEFPGNLIIREFNNVDIMILDANLPVEIQSTYTDGDYIRISDFEDRIRRQIEQNIEISGQCWLFLDEKLLRSLQNGLGRCSSVNMGWLYEFMKSGKMKVFTITISGSINSVYDKDLEFLFSGSTTCKINKDEDYRILQRNKYKIALNILKGKGFTTDEIDSMYNLFKTRDSKQNVHFVKWLMRKERTDRELEYAYSLSAINNLIHISDMLSCSIDKIKYVVTSYGFYTGLFEKDKYERVYFIDKYEISQYFPGYIRKKELWDYLRAHTVDKKTFYAIIRGETDYLWWIKNQTNIDDAWNI